jgi:hypothetical protein
MSDTTDAPVVEKQASPQPGSLTPEQQSRAKGWLESKWQKSDCPWHGPTVWQIGLLTQIGPYSQGSVFLGGPVYPAITVICTNCGYMVFINAIQAGILDRPETPVESPEADEAK